MGHYGPGGGWWRVWWWKVGVQCGQSLHQCGWSQVTCQVLPSCVVTTDTTLLCGADYCGNPGIMTHDSPSVRTYDSPSVRTVPGLWEDFNASHLVLLLGADSRPAGIRDKHPNIHSGAPTIFETTKVFLCQLLEASGIIVKVSFIGYPWVSNIENIWCYQILWDTLLNFSDFLMNIW